MKTLEWKTTVFYLRFEVGVTIKSNCKTCNAQVKEIKVAIYS